jgi:hypothetical protein
MTDCEFGYHSFIELSYHTDCRHIAFYCTICNKQTTLRLIHGIKEITSIRLRGN